MRVVMMGTGSFAQPTFQTLLTSGYQVVGLVTQPDRPVGQERGSTRQLGASMKDIAVAHSIPVLQPESINAPHGMAQLTALQPEILVVAAYGQILSRDVLGVPSLGGINVHASLLPKYRGAAPIAWAIYHGETRTGVTIIKMSTQLDAGDILAQEALDIGGEETAGELETRLAALGARLANDVLEQVAAGKAQGVKQDKSQATKAPKLTKEHGLIDWTRHARDVCNQIRAMQPWPTAYTYWHRLGQPPIRLILCKASWHEGGSRGSARAVEPVPEGTSRTEPSKPILAIGAGYQTYVHVHELQPAGKRPMAAAEFLRGHPLRESDRFGTELPEPAADSVE